MRSLLTLPILVMGIMIIASSCSKKLESPVQTTNSSSGEVLNATIGGQEAYTLTFDPSSNASIYKQASHYEISTTSVNNETGKIVYKYVPAAGYSGTDEVILSKTVKTYGAGFGGCNTGYDGEQNVMSTRTFVTVRIKVN